MYAYFDIANNRSAKEYGAIVTAINWYATDRYHDYKTIVNKQFMEHRPNVPYCNLTSKDWKKTVDLFISLKYVVSIKFIVHD